MTMFGTLDHIFGAVTVRFHRKMLRNKPDLSIVNQNLYVGGASKIEYLAKEGINAIVDTRAETNDELSELERFGMSYMRIEVHDRGVPNFEEAINAIRWIKSRLSKGSKVFIHCNLGRGRGPLMVTLYLISEGMAVNDAILTVKKARPYCYFNSKQIKMIKKFNNKKI